MATDVDLAPSKAADPAAMVARHVPEDIRAKYEVHSYRNAALILAETNAAEWADRLAALRTFTLTTRIIREPGGSESKVPQRFSELLRPLGWHETTIQADLNARLLWRERQADARGRTTTVAKERRTMRAKYLDGHKVDYVKGRVAFDLEWNSKDQTFDRDLYAFSAFSQCGVIDAGVLLTRSASLNAVFAALGTTVDKDGADSAASVSAKYGASTTWMGKLLYRLNAGRNGACPVLAVGITPACIEDWRS